MTNAIDVAPLHAGRARVLRACSDPAAAWLDRSYAPGKWTARQLLMHVADAESVFLDRIRRGVADAKPLLWAYDENEWATYLLVPGRSLTVAATLFTATRDSIIDLAGCIAPERFDRTVVHCERGKMITRELFALAVWHADHHLSQVEAIAAGTPWIKSG